MAVGEAFISWLTRKERRLHKELIESRVRVGNLTSLNDQLLQRAASLEHINNVLKTMLADEKAERVRLQEMLVNRIDKAYERKEELESLVFERIGLVHREDRKTEPPVQVGRTHTSARATLTKLESDRKKQYWEQVAAAVEPPGVDVSTGGRGNDNEIHPNNGD